MSEFFQRIGLAFKCFFLLLFAGHLPDELPERYIGRAAERRATGYPDPASAKATAGPAKLDEDGRAAESDRAVQLLALFQRDGRLVDFLAEDIDGYADDQVGAAVREVHSNCRAVLQKYIALEPVIAGEEGRPTTVEPGFDVACVKLVGTVTGRPPFRGILRHKGWRAGRVDLPSVPGDAGRNVIAPAEVEIG